MDTPKKKYGPIPKGYVDIHIDLPRVLRDWAKQQPEGVSGLMRQLLLAEYQRREGIRPRHASEALQKERFSDES